MGLQQQPCTSSSYWSREYLAPPNNNHRGRELTALRALLPAMRRCLSTGRRWPRTIPGKRSLLQSKRSPLRKDKLLMVQQSLPWKLPPQPFQYEYGVNDDYSGNAFAKTE